MKVRFSAFSLVALVALTCLPSALAQQQQQRAPVRSITRLTGDLYRVQNDDHYSVFLVTPAGIILADPINVESAIWTKAQLTERFPNSPVRYVLYSHHHQDHASGAAIFNDTAELVAHENFNASLKAALGQNEAQARRFAAVVPPESTYTERRAITLGGKTVQMLYAGPTAHANDLTVLYFPAERVVFGVDFMSVKMVPGSGTMANGGPEAINQYIGAVKAVEALDFTIVSPGHGPTGTKADLVEFRQYFENLAARVSTGIAAGRTVEDLQKAKIMDEYKTWIEYDEDNDVNIANAYKILSAQRR